MNRWLAASRTLHKMTIAPTLDSQFNLQSAVAWLCTDMSFVKENILHFTMQHHTCQIGTLGVFP